MAENALGLFGMTPESLMAARQAALQKQAQDFASLSPMQQGISSIYQAGGNLGSGIAGLMGIQDPELERVKKLQELSKQFDFTTPTGQLQAAQALNQMGFANEAAQLAKQATPAVQEEKLRTELSALPPDASEADVLGVVRKYGSADATLKATQTAADKKAQRETQLQTAREKIVADLQKAAEAGATKIELARIAQEGRTQLAQLAASLKAGSQQAQKPLSAADIKEVNKLQQEVDFASNTVQKADEFLKKIENKEMKFGAVENLMGTARGVAGQSTTSDINKAELRRFVASSVNAILNLAKGPQTEGDAIRARDQILNALDANDPKLVASGLKQLQETLKQAKESSSAALDLYSQERGGRNLRPAGASPAKQTGTADNPIVLK